MGRKFAYYDLSTFTALDLASEAAYCEDMGTPFQSYSVVIYDENGEHPEPEHAEVMFVPDESRTGIAQGADADWFDSTGDVEKDIDIWLNDVDELEKRS